jgi:nitroimidazol reductase NimA-like FMN-containing flavoprotein (pyridoxamine 5'-phosphate oxidase superfamily)
MNSKAHALLLEEPSLIGFIGSVDTDGMPRTVPVWYRWDGKFIHITTASSSVWVNNLINDSRSSFCVDENGPPYQAAVMQGRVQIDNKDEAEVRRIFLRYMDAQQTEDYYAVIKYELRMVRFEPDRVMLRSSSRSR